MTIRIGIVFLLISLSGIVAAEEKAAEKDAVHKIDLPAMKVVLKPGAGMNTTAAYCSVCHSLDYITTQPPFSKEKWVEIVNKMVKVFGAPIPPAAAREITDYLGSAYSKSGK